MIAKAATVSNARKSGNVDNSGPSAEDMQKERDMFMADSETYKNFWIGVQTAAIIQKEKLVRNAKRTKFKRNLGSQTSLGTADKIYAEHSKEVLHLASVTVIL